MRVIAGRYRGRQLHALPDLTIRPTIARLKESFFNIVQDRVAGCHFLDLCAGSGAMGIEALSRGAAEVVFVESSPQAAAILQRNLTHCGITGGYRLCREDLRQAIPALSRPGHRFDLIFFDPPYFEGLYQPTLELIDRFPLLTQDGVLIADHFKKTVLPDRVGSLHRVRLTRQGDGVLSFYAWRDRAP